MSLAEAYASDDLLSDVRVALAIGPVLIQDGDFYGPVVNLASRLVGVANPGTVLASEEFRSALLAEAEAAAETGGGFDGGGGAVRAARPSHPKPQGHRPSPGVEAVPCRYRAGHRPPAEHAVGAAWKGCSASSTSSATAASRWSIAGPSPAVGRRAASSVAVEPGGGDPLGSELEAPLERSDGTPA